MNMANFNDTLVISKLKKRINEFQLTVFHNDDKKTVKNVPVTFL